MTGPGPTDARPSEPQECLICSRPCHEGVLLCSRDRMLQANREIDENVVVLRQRFADSQVRAGLAARNGYLTSALVGWTAEHHDDGGHR